MSLNGETWLMIGILALYVYDSALLLHCNEIALQPAWQGWSVHFGSQNAGIGGKELLIPNPLFFHRPLYLLSWSFEQADERANPGWEAKAYPFWPLAVMQWMIAAGLFFLLPSGFFTRAGDRALVAALVLVYGNIGFACIWIWLNRGVFHIAPRRVASLAFESFVCPPFALNLIRHLSLAQSIPEDAVRAVHRLTHPDIWEPMRRQFVLRLDGEIELEEAQSERSKRLIKRRDKLLSGESGEIACLD